MLKPIVYIFISIAICILCSCDKLDENGNLDGNWQLTEWRDLKTDEVLETNETSKIYYTVKLNLLKMQDFSLRVSATTYNSQFCVRGDSLVLTQSYSRPLDNIVAFDSLAAYGCPADGRFKISTLTSTSLVLQTDNSRLSFRKF